MKANCDYDKHCTWLFYNICNSNHNGSVRGLTKILNLLISASENRRCQSVWSQCITQWDHHGHGYLVSWMKNCNCLESLFCFVIGHLILTEKNWHFVCLFVISFGFWILWRVFVKLQIIHIHELCYMFQQKIAVLRETAILRDIKLIYPMYICSVKNK
jgi:hypothetical protein